MVPIPLLVFHFTRVFGNAKSLVNLITKLTNRGLTNSRILYAPVNIVNAIWLP